MCFGEGRRCDTKITKCVCGHKVDLAGVAVKMCFSGKGKRKGRDVAGGQVWCGCVAASVWVCNGLGRGRLWAVGRKS